MEQFLDWMISAKNQLASQREQFNGKRCLR